MDGRIVRNVGCLVVVLVDRGLVWIVGVGKWDWGAWGMVGRDVWTYVCVIS